MPRGAPTIKIGSPTSAESESPSSATAPFFGGRSSCSNATSAEGEDDATRAPRISPPVVST